MGQTPAHDQTPAPPPPPPPPHRTDMITRIVILSGTGWRTVLDPKKVQLPHHHCCRRPCRFHRPSCLRCPQSSPPRWNPSSPWSWHSATDAGEHRHTYSARQASWLLGSGWTVPVSCASTCSGSEVPGRADPTRSPWSPRGIFLCSLGNDRSTRRLESLCILHRSPAVSTTTWIRLHRVAK